MAPPDERARVLADYEASPAKPVFTPWQVRRLGSPSVTGKRGPRPSPLIMPAAGYIFCRRTEAATQTSSLTTGRATGSRTPTRPPSRSRETNLERQALSERMRQHHLPDTALDQTVTVRVSEGQNGKRTTPLDIAPGEHLRIGATLWDKQLYNGAIVVVQSLETHPHPDTREDRLLITGHTLDGRAVHVLPRRNPRLARQHPPEPRFTPSPSPPHKASPSTTLSCSPMKNPRARPSIRPPPATARAWTSTSTASPSPSTSPPRALKTRAQEPVTDLDVLDYLARWWSRTHPKEAASDYLSRPAEQSAEQSTQLAAAAAPSTPPLPAIALDNTLSRIGQELRERALTYQHGPRITRLAAERADVLERVEALRDRARSGENQGRTHARVQPGPERPRRSARARRALPRPTLEVQPPPCNRRRHHSERPHSTRGPPRPRKPPPPRRLARCRTRETPPRQTRRHQTTTPAAGPAHPRHPGARTTAPDPHTTLTRGHRCPPQPSPANHQTPTRPRSPLDAISSTTPLKPRRCNKPQVSPQRARQPGRQDPPSSRRLLAPVRTPRSHSRSSTPHLSHTRRKPRSHQTPTNTTDGSPRAGAVWLFNPNKAERVVLCQKHRGRTHPQPNTPPRRH